MNVPFQAGDLVRIITHGLWFTPDGFAMGGRSAKGGLEFYDTIDLGSYPSTNDFKGCALPVEHGEFATIIRYMGRPLRIRHDPDWFKYDVYEILVKGEFKQAFRQNLILAADYTPSGTNMSGSPPVSSGKMS